MLSHIHISNLGIIDDLEIDFDKGLNIITGETGAGKTLIIGAIRIICGGKVNKDLIRTGMDKAFVEALFYVEDSKLKDELIGLGYDCDEIVISREIFASGRSIAKINGRLVTVSELKNVGDILVDLHGQNDNQSLLNSAKHINLLDNFAGEELSKLKETYSNEYFKRKNILNDIDRLGGNLEERVRKAEFLKFQIDEIKGSNLKLDEDDELLEKRKALANAEKVIKNLNYVYDGFSSEQGVINTLNKIKSRLEELTSIDPKYEEMLKNMNDVYYGMENICDDILKEMNGIYVDENELNIVEERLDLIAKLKRKYGNSIENIMKFYEKINNEYDEFCNSEERVEKLNNELNKVEEKMQNLALDIYKIREDTSNDLEIKLKDILSELEMPKSKFEIVVNHIEFFLQNGMDEVEIFFSPNTGESTKPLAKSASGGEISRIMLALKNVFANADIVPVMIFDEIDTGISGKAAFAVGKRMAEIAQSKQVICVTHLPSIAARGNQNFYISKENIEDRTVTSVKKLNEDETIFEIARIISGGNISETALLHAKEIRNG